MTESCEKLIQRFGAREHKFSYKGRSCNLLGLANLDKYMDNIIRMKGGDGSASPYWSGLWPSSVALSQELIDTKPDEPIEVLDMGTGLGLTSIVLARLGFRVIANDIVADALQFCQTNLRANACQNVNCVCFDWKNAPFTRKFRLIVGADVVYEQSALGPVGKLLNDHLDESGTAVITTPKRAFLDDFYSALNKLGIKHHTAIRSVKEGKRETEILVIKARR